MVTDRNLPEGEMLGFLRQCLTFVISLIVLGIIFAIATHLPGTGIWVLPGYGITIGDLVGAGIAAIIMVIVWRFGREAGPRAAKAFPQLVEVDSLVSGIVFLILILIACTSFDRIIVPFLARIGISWVYYLVFLGLAAVPLSNIARILLANSGKIAGLIVGEKREVEEATVTCTHCGSQVKQGSFCSWCGKRLAQEVNTPETCTQCRAGLPPGSKFCPSCGASVERKL